MTFEEILSRFPGPRRPNGQGGVLVECPVHKSKSKKSLSISPGNGSGPLFNDFGGCDTEAILAAAGLTWQDILPPKDESRKPAPPVASRTSGPITVSDLAKDKKLPVDFLQSLGLEDRRDFRTKEGRTFAGVLVPYRMMDGSLATRQKTRTALIATEGSGWIPGDGSPAPYGLDRIMDAREHGFLVLVEGESDCWTLWLHGFPALGIPGATMEKTLQAEYLLGIGEIFVWRETDEAGAKFAKKVPARLREIGYTGAIFEAKLDGVKDPNDLHRKDSEGFAATFQAALEAARTAQGVEISPPVVKEETLVFPDVMTGAAGEFARLYAAHMEAPAHFFFMSYLTCLGNTIADRVTISSEIHPPPRLYTLLLGESADDRKSTAASKTVDHFKATASDFPVCFGVGSAEGLQKRMAESPRLLLVLDEMKQFISKCKIESSVLLPCVTTLFEAKRYEAHTKKTSVRLENAHLSILAASTVSTYENTWSSQFTDIGFNNRLWLVPGGAAKRFSIPERIPERSQYALRDALIKTIAHADGHRVLGITPEAKSLYHEWYLSIPRSIHAKRLDTYALRLMALLAVNDLRPEVDTETVRKVTALCDHQFKVRQLHDPIDADNEAAKLEEKIRRALAVKGALGERDLKRQVHAERAGLWIYGMALGNLIKAEEVGMTKGDRRYFLKVPK